MSEAPASIPSPCLQVKGVAHNFKDLTGKTFSRLTVTGLSEIRTLNNGKRSAFWKCRCECGNDAVVQGTKLNIGHTKSCGCLFWEAVILTKVRHGECTVHATTALYKKWAGIHRRCTNPHEAGYRRYGGRGILLHGPWMDYVKFRDDIISEIGEQPSPKHSIDRIDNDRGYQPGNVRWATNKVQGNNRSNNRRVSLGGETLTLSQWSDRFGVSQGLIWMRIFKLGWNERDAITIPPNGRKRTRRS